MDSLQHLDCSGPLQSTFLKHMAIVIIRRGDLWRLLFESTSGLFTPMRRNTFSLDTVITAGQHSLREEPHDFLKITETESSSTFASYVVT